MAARSRAATAPKPPEPGVIISMTEPVGALNAPLPGKCRVAPSGVVSLTKAGAAALVKLTTPDGATRHLPGKGAFSAPTGSVIEMITPGSGGFGAVAARDQAAIGRDLLDGYVSAASAQRDYGIADPKALRKAAQSED